MVAPMRRPLVVLLLALLAVGLFAGGLAWLLDIPKPPPGAGRAERLWYARCAECHGADGRGSWRAWLFILRPGDLTDPARMRRYSDRYLFDIVKHGGAPLGRPGMPAFGFHLSDSDIEALVRYLRGLSGRPPPRIFTETPGRRRAPPSEPPASGPRPAPPRAPGSPLPRAGWRTCRRSPA